MKTINTSHYKVHVLVCTNERQSDKVSCKPLGGQSFFEKMKMKINTEGLIQTHWATRTGCLGYCNSVGTTVTVHKKGKDSVTYNEVTDADFDFIWNEIVG